MYFKLFILFYIVLFASSLPYKDQIALANSLIVGRDDNQDLFDWTCKVCDLSNKPIHSHVIEEKAVDIKCIVSVYDDFVVLAFRYTNSVLNVWEDILYPIQVVDEHACSNCKIQREYSKMWDKIKNDVLQDLKQIQLQTKIEILHITGISLGGGLATISFTDINHAQIFPVIDIVTFGSPRVGNKHWAAFFDLITLEKTRRYVVEGDPIVVLPHCLTLLCTYRQTGIKIVCRQENQKCIQENEIPDDDDEDDYHLKEIKSIGKYIRREWNQNHDIKSIVDHIEGYPKIYNYTLEMK